MAWISQLTGGAAALALSVLVVTGAQAGDLKDAPPAPPPPAKKWLPWYESGGFLSTEQHRGESSLFAPLWQSSVTLLFFQGTGRFFEDNIQEGNFALGFRKMHRSGWNVGLWGGYDVRDTEVENIFGQFAFGFEALSDRWDIRANGYVAISDPESSPELARVFVTGNTILMTGGEEVPLSGFDGEVGYKVFGHRGGHGGGLKDGPAPHGRSHELRVYAGGFYFDDDDALEEIAGPRARIEWRIDDVVRWLPGSRLTLEGEFQYDDVREEQWEGGVRFRVPFGGGGQDARATVLASLTPQERRMTESIVRDTDIVTAESDAEAVSDYLTGTAFENVTVVDNAGDLQQRIDDVGGDSLIVVKGDTHQGPIVLGPDQTLQGGGSTIRVKGAESGVVADFTAPGSRPFIELAQNQAILTVDRNTHVAGIGIRGAGQNSGLAGNFGIVPLVDGISNIAITQTMVEDVGGDGIQFGNTHNKVLVYDTTIRNAGNHGISFNFDNANVTISNTSLADVANTGIFFIDNNSNVTLSDNTLSNVARDGIFLGGGNSATITGNTLTDIDENAIDVGSAIAGSNTLTITNNTFAGIIGSDTVEFDGAVDTLLDGSDNQLAPGADIRASLCELIFIGSGFVGTLEIDGVTFVDGAGCT